MIQLLEDLVNKSNIFKKFIISKASLSLNNNDNFLINQIKQARKQNKKVDINKSIRLALKELYIPSPKSFSIVLVLVVLFFLVSHYLSPFLVNRIEFTDLCGCTTLIKPENHYQNLIAIHAGIGGIIFGLMIFIAESLRDSREKYKARVLLKVSFLFPLMVGEILTFILFGFGFYIGSFIPVISIGFLTLLSLGMTIRIMLNSYSYSMKEAEVLKERLQMSINKAIEERIGCNVLFSKLDGNPIKLEYRLFSIDDISEYHSFQTEKLGIITDINLKKLQEFAELVEEEANNNGYAWEEGDKANLFNNNIHDSTESKTTLTPKTDRYLLKMFRGRVDNENNTLLCVHKELIKNPKVLDKLRGLIDQDQIFTIEKDDNFSEETQYDLSSIKDQAIDSINNHRIGKLEEIIKLYLKLVRSYLEFMKENDAIYSFEQSKKERHSIGGGWSEIEWLRSDIRVIVLQAIESNNLEVIRKVVYLPKTILRTAIDFNDHYLFQEFAGFSELIYLRALKITDNEVKEFLIDRSWRYLKETSDYDIEPKIRKGNNETDEYIELNNYVIHLFTILQNLLKKAFDNKDLDSFKKFIKAVNDIFKRKSYIRETRENKKEIEKRKKQMLFGLASWIFDCLDVQKDNNVIFKFYQEICQPLPPDIEKLTLIFLSTHDFEVEDFWGWGWWELKWEGEVQCIQFLEKLERFYAVRALSLLENKTGEEIEKISLPHNRNLANLAEGSRDLIKTLDNIAEKPNDWKFVLSQQAAEKVPALKELINKAKDRYKEEEKESVRKATISPGKVNEFKEKAINGFHQSTGIREIFTYYNLYEKNMSDNNKVERYGYNMTDGKSYFLEEPDVHLLNFGTIYGESLEENENNRLIDIIEEKCQLIQENDFDEIFSKFNDPSDIFILGINFYFAYSETNFSNNFITKWLPGRSDGIDLNCFEGWYPIDNREFPVFEISGSKKLILILNKSKLGNLIQYSPLKKKDDPQLLNDIFYINVQAFSQNKELLKELLDNPPDWLLEVGDNEQQEQHLLEKVLVHFYEKFEFQLADDFVGYKIIVEK